MQPKNKVLCVYVCFVLNKLAGRGPFREIELKEKQDRVDYNYNKEEKTEGKEKDRFKKRRSQKQLYDVSLITFVAGGWSTWLSEYGSDENQ